MHFTGNQVIASWAIATLAVMLGALVPASARDEFHVNTYTAGVQRDAAAARLGKGAVVVWASYKQVAPDSQGDIFGQRLSASGAKIGSEFQVNTTTAGDQTRPSVAVLADGTFVVAWQTADGIAGQHFAADASKLGGEFLLVDTTSGTPVLQGIVPLTGGGFAASWFVRGAGYPSCNNRLLGARFGADGSADGSKFRIGNLYFGFGAESAGLAPLADGGFIAIWTECTNDPDRLNVRTARYDAGGNKTELVLKKIAARSYKRPGNPRIAELSDGGFAVTWQAPFDPGDQSSIFAQRYSADFDKIGPRLQLPLKTYIWQFDPAVAALEDGRFVTVWTRTDSFDVGATEYSTFTVRGQRIGADGNAEDNQFRASTTSKTYEEGTEVQPNPAVVPLARDGFLVVWTLGDISGGDVGIVARVYRP